MVRKFWKCATCPIRKPKPGEVIVRVEAVGVNFADTMSTRGTYPGTPPPPFISGREFAGVVEATGERVMGYTQYGAAAEKIAMKPKLLWPQPAGWTSVQSAAFPVNFLTAYLAYWKAGMTADAMEPIQWLDSAPAPRADSRCRRRSGHGGGPDRQSCWRSKPTARRRPTKSWSA